jgi:hypothetical protein
MTPADEMTTLSAVLEKLQIKHIDNGFRWTGQGFTAGKGKTYNPEELTITTIYRFEGDADPSGSSILYIIEANDGLRGYSLDSYGMYSNRDNKAGYDNFIRLIKVENRDDQLLFEI